MSEETTIVVNGKNVDLSKSLPLTIGAMKRLKKAHGLDLANSQDNLDIDKMSKLIFFICNNSEATITEEDIDEISSIQLPKIMDVFRKLQGTIDPPT